MANKQKILTSAQKFAQKGNYAKAIREYERAVEIDPSDLRVLLKLGEAQQKGGDVRGASATYIEVAQKHASTGFLLKAAAVYKRVLSLDPRNVQVHVSLAEVYHQLGLLSDAMSFYYSVANILLEAGDSLGYQDVLDRMATIEPDNVGIRIKLAEHYSKTGELDKAVEEFSHASTQLRRTGRIDDYVKVAERLIYHQPNNTDRIKELVRVYLEQGDTRRALAKIQQCTRVDTQDTETLDLLVQTFQALGQPEKSHQVLREKAKIHDSREELQEAQDCWRQLLEANPLDLEVRERLGLAPPDTQEPEAHSGSAPMLPPVNTTPKPSTPAVHTSQAMPAVNAPPIPNNAPAPPPEEPDNQHLEIARLLTETDVYIKYGLVDRAFEHLRKVFLMDPNNLDAMERIKEMHFQAGYYPQAVDELLRMTKLAYHRDTPRAIAYMREAMQIMPDNEEVLQLAASYGLSRDDLFPQNLAQIAIDALPSADSVDTMLAQMTAEMGAEPTGHSGQVPIADGEIEIDIDMEVEEVPALEPEIAGFSAAGDIEVFSQMDDLDALTADDLQDVEDLSLSMFDGNEIIERSTSQDMPPVGAVAKLSDLQEGFGLSDEELAKISRDLGLDSDDEEDEVELTDEGVGLMEELFLDHDMDDDDDGPATEESYTSPFEDEGQAEEIQIDWSQQHAAPASTDDGQIIYVDDDDDDDDDDLILIDDESEEEEFIEPPPDTSARPAARIVPPPAAASGPRRSLVTPPPPTASGPRRAIVTPPPAAASGSRRALVTPPPPAPTGSRRSLVTPPPVAASRPVSQSVPPPAAPTGSRRSLVTPPPPAPSRPKSSLVPQSTITSAQPPQRAALVTPPPEPAPTPTPTAEEDKPLSPYAAHFQNEVATTAYAPFSDRGTVTEADLRRSQPTDEAEGDQPTAMLDIFDMRRRMMEDMALKSSGSIPARIAKDDSMTEELRLDLEETDFYVVQGLIDEARSALQELLERHPEHPAILKRIERLDAHVASTSAPAPAPSGPVTGHTGPPSAASAALSTLDLADTPALESAGQDGLSAHFELGLAYREMGLHQDSITEFRYAIGEHLQIAESLFLIGQSHIDLGNISDAATHFRQALQVQGANEGLTLHALYRLGLVCEALGDPSEASGCFQRLSGHTDLFPDIEQRLGRLSQR